MRISLRLPGILLALALVIAACSLTVGGTTGNGSEDSYSVNIVTTISDGTVTASPASGSAGSVITITVTPASGKVLKNGFPIVSIADGTAINLTDVSDLSAVKFTFTLPAASVTVNAEFDDLSSPGSHGITIPAFSYGTITSSVASSPVTSAQSGNTVTLTVTPDPGCSLKAGTLKVTKTGDPGVVVSTSPTFTMPDHSVTVSAVFEGIPKSIKLTGFDDVYTGEWQVMLLPTATPVMNDIVAVAEATPAVGIITGPLMAMAGGSPLPNQWAGTGSYYIYLAPDNANDHPTVNRYISKTAVSFTQALTEYAMNSATFDTIVPPAVNFVVTDSTQLLAAVTQIIDGGSGSAGNPRKYSLTINSPITIFAMTEDMLSSYIEITFNGSGSLSLSGTGSLLRVEENQTFIIDSPSLELIGNGSNDSSLVTVDGTNARLELKAGTISGNTGEEGAGVIVIEGAFNMSGGTISNNTATNRGGGVEVSDDGVFTMSAGTISNNIVTGGGGSGGVYVRGAFTMSGGYIQGNTAGSGVGGGVNVRNHSNTVFTMTGGTIYGNTESVISLRNTATTGAALYNDGCPLATNGGVLISTTDTTITGTP